MMRWIVIAAQVAVAFGLLNVWLLRLGKRTAWRGGNAQNMTQEFATYGLPPWFMHLVGFLKISLAVLLLVGLWIPGVSVPAAIGVVTLMIGALGMHVKVRDPIRKSLPALSVLALALVVVLSER